MPTYEYECQECGYQFEAFQPITADPLEECPQCKGKVKRLISRGGGILFKGSGFYTTDYRSSEYQAKAKAESGGGEKSSGGDSSSSGSSSSES